MNPPSMSPRSGLCLAVLVAVLAPGCRDGQEPLSSPTVAQVGGTTITTAELEAELVRRARASALPLPAEARETVLEDLIRHQVLLARARAAGYAERPEVRRQMERVLTGRYEAEQGPDFERLPAPTEAEISTAYEARQAEFVTPERVRVALIVLRGSAKTEPERRTAWQARAERLRDEAAAGDAAAFATLARQHSDDRATRYSGGEAGWLTRDSAEAGWPREVVEAAWALEVPGAVSPVIEAGPDLHILRLLERRPAALRSLVEVRDQLKHQLILARRQEAEREFEARLREGVVIQVHRPALEEVTLPPASRLAGGAAPPGLPAR